MAENNQSTDIPYADSDSTLELRAESDTSTSEISNMASRSAPLSHQLQALYEENIAAKVLKTAVNGLVNNVSEEVSILASDQ